MFAHLSLVCNVLYPRDMQKLLLLFVALAAAACTPQPKHPTTPSEYVCSSFSVVRNGSEVKTSDSGLVGKLSWRDSAGEHFVAWPVSPTDRDAIEFVLPDDSRLDGEQRTYDTTFGSSVADWRLVTKHACTARGGYNDVLARYLKGESLDDLTRSLALSDRDETRGLIRHALTTLQRRYWRDR